MVDGYEARIANRAMRCGGCGNGVDTGDEYGAAEIIVAIAVLCMDCMDCIDGLHPWCRTQPEAVDEEI